MSTQTLAEKVASRTDWSIFMGFLTAFAGIAMICYPLATATASTVVLGWLLGLAAVGQFVFALSSHSAGSFVVKLLLGVLYGLAALGLVAFPITGMITITTVVGITLIVEAVLEAIVTFAIPALTGRVWFFVSALTSLLLGILVLAGWPKDSVWVIGTFLGIAVLVNGITRIVVASAVRKEVLQSARLAHA